MTFVYLLAAFLLVLLNGFFVLAEFAAVKMRPSRVRELQDDGVSGAAAARHVQDHLDELRGGDLVLLWEEGENAGLYALGTLVGDPYDGEAIVDGGPAAKWIRWRLDATLTPPPTKDELRAHDVLKGLQHFDRKDAANIPVDAEQWAALKAMLHAEPGFEPVVGD